MAYRPTSHSIKSALAVFPAVEETLDPTILIIVYQVYVTQFKTCWQFEVIWRDPPLGQCLHMSFRAVVEGKGDGRQYPRKKSNHSVVHNYLRKASWHPVYRFDVIVNTSTQWGSRISWLPGWVIAVTSPNNLCLAKQSPVGQGLLIHEVSRSHTVRHSTTGMTPLKSDQLIAEAATYITHNEHNRRTSIPSEGFEPPIPAIKQPQTNAIDHTATAIGFNRLWRCMLPYIS